jgi:hypothetical protein
MARCFTAETEQCEAFGDVDPVEADPRALVALWCKAAVALLPTLAW